MPPSHIRAVPLAAVRETLLGHCPLFVAEAFDTFSGRIFLVVLINMAIIEVAKNNPPAGFTGFESSKQVWKADHSPESSTGESILL
jgi:hypothetical protein